MREFDLRPDYFVAVFAFFAGLDFLAVAGFADVSPVALVSLAVSPSTGAVTTVRSFENGHFGGVANPVANANDTRVAALPVAVLFAEFGKQFADKVAFGRGRQWLTRRSCKVRLWPR